VDGIFSAGFHANAEFEYNGSTNMNQGHMDNDLIITEDSLVFMYRVGAGYEWEEVNGYEVVTGSSITNKRGSIVIDSLKRGEYVLARYDFTASITHLNSIDSEPFAFPNPNKGQFNLKLPQGDWNTQLYDVNGALIGSWKVRNQAQIDLQHIASGTYILKAKYKNSVLSQKMIIE
jgi:hypothetical protein